MTESFDHPAALEVWREPVFWIDVVPGDTPGALVTGVIMGRNSAMRSVAVVESMGDARFVTRALRAYAATEAGRADPDWPW